MPQLAAENAASAARFLPPSAEVNGARGQSQDLVAKMREVSDTIALGLDELRLSYL